jgi:hypothetical protein
MRKILDILTILLFFAFGLYLLRDQLPAVREFWRALGVF